MKSKTFPEPLFMASIEGRKTQFRELVSKRALSRYYDYYDWYMSVGKVDGIANYGYHSELQFFNGCARKDLPANLHFARYQPGDIVYLKEPYCMFDEYIVFYKHGDCDWLSKEEKKTITADLNRLHGWRNSITMPASAARYFIKITGVRAERLQDISESDCLKEGVHKLPYTTGDGNTYYSYWNGVKDKAKRYSKKTYFSYEMNSGRITQFTVSEEEAARRAYRYIFEYIIGKGKTMDLWESNPFVWVYDFEMTDKTE